MNKKLAVAAALVFGAAGLILAQGTVKAQYANAVDNSTTNSDNAVTNADNAALNADNAAVNDVNAATNAAK